MLTLLHTADVHVETFGALAREIDDSVPVRHEVRAELLETALRLGPSADGVRAAVATVLQGLARAGARVVLCTCSTIGAVAEAARAPDCVVLRVDRPVVERAVASGRRILLVAALPTALKQTLHLLRQVASDEQRAPEVVEVLCEGAWRLFESGDTSGYLAAVASAVASTAAPGDLVLLAQASMAPVAELVARSDLAVFSSPRLGVRAACEAYRRGENRAPSR
jgi:hypothetical protein